MKPLSRAFRCSKCRQFKALAGSRMVHNAQGFGPKRRVCADCVLGRVVVGGREG